jgi:DNA-binding IclR family transcriptional regulator
LYPSNSDLTRRSGTAHTAPQTYKELKAVVVQTAEQGYAVEKGEVSKGLASIGVVVRDHLGWPAAGIAITFAEDALPGEDLHSEPAQQMISELTQTAQELSRRIRGVV